MRKLKDYQPFLSALLRTIADECHFESREPLATVLRNPRLVVAINHSTPISWIPPICLLAEKFNEAGGGERTPRGVIDKFFYTLPILRMLAEYISQSDRPRDFDEILQDFTAEEKNDLVVFPEGAMAFFGDLRKIQPFRSPRFVELAIRARSPILIAVHRGTEEWNSLFPIPKEITPYINMVSSFFGRRFDEEQFVNVPMNLHRIPKLSMITKLYIPELYEADLSEDPRERRRQISAEADRIRDQMQDLFDELGSKRAKPARKADKRG